MKLKSPMFGIVLEGKFSPVAIVIDRASFPPESPFKEEIQVRISAHRENGKIKGMLDKIIFECPDMSDAMIKMCLYCLEKLAMREKEKIHLQAEIDTLTA